MENASYFGIMKNVVTMFCPAIFAVWITISAFTTSAPVALKSQSEKPRFAIPPSQLAYMSVRDTVFVTGDKYIEISLTEQMARLIYRDGKKIEFKISSGNKFIRDGMETPTGIFAVQGKAEMAKSKQFNDAKLHWWVGFNGNIGFHGLDGNGYYWNLGNRPSSHGCVRIGREDGKKLFQSVEKGTPVLVYKSRPARILAFADSTEFNPSRDFKLASRGAEQTKMLRARMKNLYSGKHFVANTSRVFLDGKTPIWMYGFEAGEQEKVPFEQERPTVTGLTVRQSERDRMCAFSWNHKRDVVADSAEAKTSAQL
ncbi:MAG TPA: L,D-transpeptidase [Patescibacteria group bacterium]|nr:L,D-transpeptidase [Patescibacteria group bacterium]